MQIHNKQLTIINNNLTNKQVTTENKKIQ